MFFSLRETKKCKRFLFRGINYPHDVEKGFEERVPRKDRRPTDTPKRVQLAFDIEYENKYNWRPRSTGVFCANLTEGTYGYGHTYYIFPIGKYRYTWSPDVKDFFITQGRIGMLSKYTDKQLLQEMEKLVKTYKDSKDLCRVLSDTSVHEVILGCKKFYGVHWRKVFNERIIQEFEDALWR